jgi:hypothetical protein
LALNSQRRRRAFALSTFVNLVFLIRFPKLFIRCRGESRKAPRRQR